MKRLIAILGLLALVGTLALLPAQRSEAKLVSYWAFVNPVTGPNGPPVIKVNNVPISWGANYIETASCSVLQPSGSSFQMVKAGTTNPIGPRPGNVSGTVGFTAIWIDYGD